MWFLLNICARVIPNARKARLCNVRKYGKSLSLSVNFSLALSNASFAAFLVKARYAILFGAVPSVRAFSTSPIK